MDEGKVRLSVYRFQETKFLEIGDRLLKFPPCRLLRVIPMMIMQLDLSVSGNNQFPQILHVLVVRLLSWIEPGMLDRPARAVLVPARQLGIVIDPAAHPLHAVSRLEVISV